MIDFDFILRALEDIEYYMDRQDTGATRAQTIVENLVEDVYKMKESFTDATNTQWEIVESKKRAEIAQIEKIIKEEELRLVKNKLKWRWLDIVGLIILSAFTLLFITLIVSSFFI